MNREHPRSWSTLPWEAGPLLIAEPPKLSLTVILPVAYLPSFGLCGSFPDCKTVSLCDGYAGSCLRIIGKVHIDCAGCIVVKNSCNSACVNSVFTLYIEGDAAALYEYNLTGYINTFIILWVTCNAFGKDYIVLYTRKSCERLVRIVGFNVEYVCVTYCEEVTCGTCVVDGSNCEGVCV